MASVPTYCWQCARQTSQMIRRVNCTRGFSYSARLAEAHSKTLLPSVQFLLHENHISSEDASNIPASGPNGRLLKGDVLAYVGQIDKSYPQEQAKRIDKLSHLDLSNIKIAAPKETKAEAVSAKAAAPEELEETEIAVPISLGAVLACQRRLQDSLGITLPLTTFIARAIEMANNDLPRLKRKQPTADELFNSIVGVRSERLTTSDSKFVPSMATLPFSTPVSHAQASQKPDIIDVLSGKRPSSTEGNMAPKLEVSEAENVFSLCVEEGEEQRATVFLERMKAILELDPGRLVL